MRSCHSDHMKKANKQNRFTADIPGALQALGSVMPPEAVEAIVALVDNSARQIAAHIVDETEKRKKIERAFALDQRRHNVHLLLEHYQLLRDHRQEAVYDVATIERAKEVTPEELFDIMRQTIPKYDMRMEGIEKSASRTHLLMCHLDLALDAYRSYCESSPNEAQQRRWRVVRARYLDEPRKTCKEIAKDEGVVKRMIERDVQSAIGDLSVKLFGVDALENLSE